MCDNLDLPIDKKRGGFDQSGALGVPTQEELLRCGTLGKLGTVFEIIDKTESTRAMREENQMSGHAAAAEA